MSFEGTFLELSYFCGGEVAETIYRLLVRLWITGGEAIREKCVTSGAVATAGMYCSVVGFPKCFKVGGLNSACCFYGIDAVPANEFDNNGS